MEFLKNILEFIFGNVYYSWSIFINGILLSSYSLLYIFTIILNIIVFFVLRTIKRKNIHIFLSLFFLFFSYFIFIQPFILGDSINRYLDKGLVVVEILEKYNLDNGTYPKEIGIVYSMNFADSAFIKKNCKYTFVDIEDLNKKNNVNYYKEDFYNLEIFVYEIDKKFIYNRQRKKFIMQD